MLLRAMGFLRGVNCGWISDNATRKLDDSKLTLFAANKFVMQRLRYFFLLLLVNHKAQGRIQLARTRNKHQQFNMKRIFGIGKTSTPAPSLDDISQRMGARADTVDKKLNQIDTELNKIKQQIKSTKSKPVQDRLKQRAAVLIKQRRMYEGHQSHLMQQQFNVDQTSFTTNTLKESVDTVNAMQAAAKEMKKQYKNINLDKVESVQDDLFDMMAEAEEIQDVLSRTYETPDYVDEDDIMGELDALEDSMEADSSYLDTDLNVPTNAPSESSKQQQAMPASNKQLEQQLGL